MSNSPTFPGCPGGWRPWAMFLEAHVWTDINVTIDGGSYWAGWATPAPFLLLVGQPYLHPTHFSEVTWRISGICGYTNYLVIRILMSKQCAKVPHNTTLADKTKKNFLRRVHSFPDPAPSASAAPRQIWPTHFWDTSAALECYASVGRAWKHTAVFLLFHHQKVGKYKIPRKFYQQFSDTRSKREIPHKNAYVGVLVQQCYLCVLQITNRNLYGQRTGNT